MIKKSLLTLTIFLLSNSLFAADDSSATSLQRRVFMLEFALAPKSPAAVAKTWAQAAKDRNGAVQYMLLCPELQAAKLSTLKELNWVTGLSSPQVGTYKITPGKSNNNLWRYDVTYQIVLNNKIYGSNVDHLQLIKTPDKNSSQQWCIKQFNLLSPAADKPK